MPEVVRRAPAKVNLALSVGSAEPREVNGVPNPRAGWHRIASWMVCVDLCDVVTVKPTGHASTYDIRWATDAPKPTPIDWPVPSDLAVRAHRALERTAGRELGVHLTLEKRIPVGGGLGGGSSDAAMTLLAIREAFELEITDQKLMELGATLGSDVPFFISPNHQSGVIHGFGERVERTPRRSGGEHAALLIIPPFGCATPEVYRAFDRLHAPGASPRVPEDDRVRTLAHGPVDPALWFNDLEEAANAVEPRLAEFRLLAERAFGVRVMLTGSGSTLIALIEPDRVEFARKTAASLTPGVLAVVAPWPWL